MLHSNKALIGDTIRAYDFAPMAGRDDVFVEGIVEDNNNTEHGYLAYKIKVTADKFHEFETVANDKNRIGRTVYVPHQISFMEFQHRVVNLSKISIFNPNREF
jgi:DNA polymerase II small subunit/DNA polymerase delta subunit B